MSKHLTVTPHGRPKVKQSANASRPRPVAYGPASVRPSPETVRPVAKYQPVLSRAQAARNAFAAAVDEIRESNPNLARAISRTLSQNTIGEIVDWPMEMQVAEQLMSTFPGINIADAILHGAAAAPFNLRTDRAVASIEWNCDPDKQELYPVEANYVKFRLPLIEEERTAYRLRQNTKRRTESSEPMDKQGATSLAQKEWDNDIGNCQDSWDEQAFIHHRTKELIQFGQ